VVSLANIFFGAWLMGMHAIIFWGCMTRGATWWLFARFWGTFALYRNVFGILGMMAFVVLQWGESLGSLAGFLPAMVLTTWIVWKRIPKEGGDS